MNQRSCSGLIPAHAGKTSDGLEWDLVGEAHPRSRGENVQHVECEQIPRGSSPLTRGKQVRVLVAILQGGLIPAHAGKTCRS